MYLCYCEVRASPEAPPAPPVAVLEEGQQLAPGQEEAAEGPQDALQVSLQHACGLQCNAFLLHLQARPVLHGDMRMLHRYAIWAEVVII